jgi:hypothetical protein
VLPFCNRLLYLQVNRSFSHCLGVAHLVLPMLLAGCNNHLVPRNRMDFTHARWL